MAIGSATEFPPQHARTSRLREETAVSARRVIATLENRRGDAQNVAVAVT
jgi:hypothetical protein